MSPDLCSAKPKGSNWVGCWLSNHVTTRYMLRGDAHSCRPMQAYARTPLLVSPRYPRIISNIAAILIILHVFSFIIHGMKQKFSILYYLNFQFVQLKGPYPGKWHVFVLALLYLFECLNEWRQHSDRLQFLETSVGNVIRLRKRRIMTKCRSVYFCLCLLSTRFLMRLPCLTGEWHRVSDLIISHFL